MKYRVTLCREYWGHIDVEADSKSDAIRKVEDYEYEGEFVMTKIGEQSVYGANPLESEVEEGGERIMKLLYVRFGEIPTNGKSKNYLTGEYEKGVSVYEALERDEKMLILLPNLTGSACVTLSGVLDRPMFIVDGELCGTGSDGEPLLKNCKIVREIKNINHSRGW